MHIGGEYIQNLPMNIELGKKTFKIDKFEKTPFHAFSLGVGQIPFSNCPMYAWLMELRVVIPKPTLMNHHH